MAEVTPYSNIEDKGSVKSKKITDEEALIRALDLLDFYASLVSLNDDRRQPNDIHKWLELNYLSDDQ